MSRIEQAAHEAPAHEDARAYQAGRHDMRSAAASMLSARAIDLRAAGQSKAADAFSQASMSVEAME